jgi:hypothetical protein
MYLEADLVVNVDRAGAPCHGPDVPRALKPCRGASIRHEFRDEVVRDRLARHVRDDICITRMPAEEWVLLVPATDIPDVQRLRGVNDMERLIGGFVGHLFHRQRAASNQAERETGQRDFLHMAQNLRQ